MQTSLRSQHRRGIPIYTHTSDSMVDMHSMLYNTRSGRLLMGGMQNKMLEVDMATGRELRAVNVEKGHHRSGMDEGPALLNGGAGTAAIMREHSRFVASGDVPSGRIHLRDPHSLNVAHTLDAHTGVLSDFDVHGHHL